MGSDGDLLDEKPKDALTNNMNFDENWVLT